MHNRLAIRRPAAAQCLAIDGHDLALCALGHRRDPIQKALFQLLGGKRLKDAIEGVMRRNALRKLEKTGKPSLLGFAKSFHLIPTARAANNRSDRDEYHVFQHMTACALHARIGQFCKILKGTRHQPISIA